MKLFFVVENNQPHASGGGYYAIFKFAEFLARRGHSVQIHSVHDFEWVQPTDNLKIFYRPFVPRSKRVFRKLDKLLSRFWLRFVVNTACRSMRPDWVVGVLRESAIRAVWLGTRHEVPVANFTYECPLWTREMTTQEQFDSWYRGPVRELWEQTRQAYRASTVLLPNSQLSGRYLSRWLDGKAVGPVIHPGIDERSMPYEGYDEPREQDSAFRLLCVGRLERAKRVDLFVRAAQRVQQDIIVDIVGDGPEKEMLLRLSGKDKRIRLHGYLPDNRLWELFRTCYLVVYPTEFEGFGMPPMQALYFEKCCLASDIPVLRSIYGERIEYFRVGDEDELVSSIERLLEDGAYRQRRGREGRRFVLDNFSWELAAEKIEKALAAGHAASFTVAESHS
jgi:glycosyltransferase involved in cell wall biosynthesis